MALAKAKALALVAVALACVAAVSGASGEPSVAYNKGVSNTKVLRSVNLQTHIEEDVFQIDVLNGNTETDYYLVPVAAAKAQHLSILTARQLPKASAKDDDDDDEIDGKAGVALRTTKVTVTGAEDAPAGTVFYKVQLKTPLAAKGTVRIAVTQIFTRTLVPYPAEISQAETQLVLFTDSVYPFSAYPTKGDSATQVKLATDKIQSHTKKNVEVKGDTLRYGPYVDVAAFASQPLSVHFENEYPFVTMSSARKLIEISHFGNINVEEHYVLQHTGAKLRGVFSRYDYQRQQKQGASFRSISGVLPASASNIYYRDQIGNISTSAVLHTSTHTQMDVQPRFPMFGGWQTDFYIGYDVPAHEFLSVDANNGGRYVLNMSLVSTPFVQAAIDELEVHVIFPEFTSGIRWVSPFEVDSEEFSSHVTYLDTVGRPVLILRKSNVVRAHDQRFQVVYDFSATYLLHEPLLLVASFFGLFALAMVYFRIELSLSDPKEDRRALNAARTLRVGPIGDILNAIAAQLPPVLQQLLRLTKADAKGTGEALNRLRSGLAELRADPLLNNAVERLENQLKLALSAYKRALEAGASAADASADRKSAGGAAEGERAGLVRKLKERVEDAEKTLEELIDL